MIVNFQFNLGFNISHAYVLSCNIHSRMNIKEYIASLNILELKIINFGLVITHHVLNK
jgi:hypothetical protein